MRCGREIFWGQGLSKGGERRQHKPLPTLLFWSRDAWTQLPLLSVHLPNQSSPVRLQLSPYFLMD